MEACPICDNEGIYLGSLDKLAHFRCRGCGMDFHKDVDSVVIAESEEG